MGLGQRDRRVELGEGTGLGAGFPSNGRGVGRDLGLVGGASLAR